MAIWPESADPTRRSRRFQTIFPVPIVAVRGAFAPVRPPPWPSRHFREVRPQVVVAVDLPRPAKWLGPGAHREECRIILAQVRFG